MSIVKKEQNSMQLQGWGSKVFLLVFNRIAFPGLSSPAMVTNYSAQWTLTNHQSDHNDLLKKFQIFKVAKHQAHFSITHNILKLNQSKKEVSGRCSLLRMLCALQSITRHLWSLFGALTFSLTGITRQPNGMVVALLFSKAHKSLLSLQDPAG